jgi:hypothetical protein
MLAVRAGVGSLNLDLAVDESKLDAAALELRQRWFAAAHRPADVAMKSPCAGTTATMPGGGSVSLGYERDLDVSLLENRCPPDHVSPAGWRSTRILCRSGQAALSCLLHLVASLDRKSEALRVHHAGRYFETRALLNLWSSHGLRLENAETSTVDVLVGEPVQCDGQFAIADPTTLPRAGRALLLDTTLSGPRVELAPWFAKIDGPLLAVFRSGLKLDQAGLELASVGIIQLFVRDDDDLGRKTEELRRIRALTGSGLTLDEMAALSAPWFLDAAYLRAYSNAIFANNAALAQAIGRSTVFEDACHPSLLEGASAEAVAPFCTFRLRNGELGAHRKLLAAVEAAITQRGLVVPEGGSFGFRGARYELVEPANGRPFLRVAMGFRGGDSAQRFIEILCDLA